MAKDLRKNTAVIFMVSVLVAFAAATAVIFLAVPPEIFNCAHFYVSLAFFWVCNVAMAAYLSFGIKAFKKDDLVAFTPLIYFFAAGVVAFGVALYIFTLKSFFISIGVVIGVDIGLAAIYFLAVLLYTIPSRYVKDLEAERKEKVAFIDGLKISVSMLADRASDEQVKAALKKLESDVRYSDPFSAESLKGIENEIVEKVDALRADLKTAEKADILNNIEEISSLLKERNLKCVSLK